LIVSHAVSVMAKSPSNAIARASAMLMHVSSLVRA
jgi:hypothetical protein